MCSRILAIQRSGDAANAPLGLPADRGVSFFWAALLNPCSGVDGGVSIPTDRSAVAPNPPRVASCDGHKTLSDPSELLPELLQLACPMRVGYCVLSSDHPSTSQERAGGVDGKGLPASRSALLRLAVQVLGQRR